MMRSAKQTEWVRAIDSAIDQRQRQRRVTEMYGTDVKIDRSQTDNGIQPLKCDRVFLKRDRWAQKGRLGRCPPEKLKDGRAPWKPTGSKDIVVQELGGRWSGWEVDRGAWGRARGLDVHSPLVPLKSEIST
jgi:hypothetical protein